MRFVLGLSFVACMLAGCGGSQGSDASPPAGGAAGSSGVVGGASGTGASSASGGVLANGGAGAVAGIAPVTGGAAGAGDDPILPNSLAVGPQGSCAIGHAGRLSCWGKLPSGIDWVLPQGTFKAVALEGLGCAQSVAGDIACFLQPGTLADTSIAPTGKFGSFDVGISSMCALDSSGTVTCKETPGPQLLQGAPAGVKFSQVSVGDLFACAIRADNSELVCWGAAGDDGACAASPKTGQLDAPSGAFMQVSSTLFHSCAVRMDHTVACWGSGDATDDPNQILCNDKLNYGQSVAPAGSFVQVSAGSLHSCGVHTDGTVACWGAGTKQGDCANDVDACGQSIPATGSFVQVAAGYTHSCGMRADRSVQCWGSNTGGRSTPPADFP